MIEEENMQAHSEAADQAIEASPKLDSDAKANPDTSEGSNDAKPRARRRVKKSEDAAVDTVESESEEKPARKRASRAKASEPEESAPKAEGESSEEAEKKPRRVARKRKAEEEQPTEAGQAASESKAQTETSLDSTFHSETESEPASEVHVTEKPDTHEGDSSRTEADHADSHQKPKRFKQRNENGAEGYGKKNKKNRHQRRQHQSNQNREPIVPKTTAEDLMKLKVVELRQKAEELGIEHKGLLKADLVAAVLEASVKKEGFVNVEGVLDILSDGYGFLRTDGYLPSEHDVYVGLSNIRRNGLRKGDYVKGQVRPARDNEKFAALQRIDSVNGLPLEELGRRPRFADLTPIYPDSRLLMEHGRNAITARVIDLAAPIGKGQRGLIVSPPKAGKTTVLKDIAASIAANNPEVHLMCLLVDERPEEVTDMQRSIRGEVISSTFDMPAENHIAVAEMVIERAKRLVENGEDVVILLDSITRLARAYNLAQPASGRILSGGVDSTALYPPKRFLGAARNIENGGSLTILASALIDTGSKMDEVIFEEFKGTGNMELKLDRNLADRRIFPAIDPVSSGTRKEELLLDSQEAPLIWAVRRLLSNMNNTERAMDMLIKSLKQTDTNQAFLLRTAKKAQGYRSDENFEL